MKQRKQVQLGSDQYEKEQLVCLLITIEQSNGIVVSLAAEQYLCLSHRTQPVTLRKDSQARTDTRQHMWNEPTRRQKGTERSVVVCFWTKLSARCGLAIFLPLSSLPSFPLPPSLWLCVCQTGPVLFMLDACLWPRGMLGHQGGSRMPTGLEQSKFWDNRTAWELGALDSRYEGVMLCAV